MGRELRRVPPNWDHPKTKNRRGVMEYQAMFDQAFVPAMREWIAGWEAWERGERPSYCSEESRLLPYWEWHGGPPAPEYYRPDWKPEEMTWFQVYETVSEGTPVSPPFATREELVEYLVANGDFWDQDRPVPRDPWPREAAESFVFGSGWAPSMVIDGGRVMRGVEALPTLPSHDND